MKNYQFGLLSIFINLWNIINLIYYLIIFKLYFSLQDYDTIIQVPKTFLGRQWLRISIWSIKTSIQLQWSFIIWNRENVIARSTEIKTLKTHLKLTLIPNGSGSLTFSVLVWFIILKSVEILPYRTLTFIALDMDFLGYSLLRRPKRRLEERFDWAQF